MPEMKHPCRCAITGLTHTVDKLHDLIKGHDEISDEMKAVLMKELLSKKQDAATIDFHVIDHGNGDTSFCGHIKWVKLG